MFDQPVRRRRVFYCMGFDPKGPLFYHALFAHQFDLYCRRYNLRGSVTACRDDEEGVSSNWNVRLADLDWSVESRYTFLRWDDLVAKYLERKIHENLWLKLRCDLDAITSGTIFRILRLNWKFTVASIYPTLAILGLVFIGLCLGGALDYAVQTLGAPAWAGHILAIMVAYLAFMRGYRILSAGYFLNLLVTDGIFSFQHARGQRHDYLARLDRFAELLVDAVNTSEDDEVVVVGHSSGSFCAVEVLARALRMDPELASKGPRLCLLTVGANLPLIACHPAATSFRQDVALVAARSDVFWLEYQATQDLLNFPRFDPGRTLAAPVLGDRQANPIVHSARFTDSLHPQNYRRHRFNCFRLHFQYLMAVDRPVPCDYIMIVAGPASLEQRGTDPIAAMELCLADGIWPYSNGDLKPTMPVPPGRILPEARKPQTASVPPPKQEICQIPYAPDYSLPRNGVPQ